MYFQSLFSDGYRLSLCILWFKSVHDFFLYFLTAGMLWYMPFGDLMSFVVTRISMDLTIVVSKKILDIEKMLSWLPSSLALWITKPLNQIFRLVYISQTLPSLLIRFLRIFYTSYYFAIKHNYYKHLFFSFFLPSAKTSFRRAKS